MHCPALERTNSACHQSVVNAMNVSMITDEHHAVRPKLLSQAHTRKTTTSSSGSLYCSSERSLQRRLPVRYPIQIQRKWSMYRIVEVYVSYGHDRMEIFNSSFPFDDLPGRVRLKTILKSPPALRTKTSKSRCRSSCLITQYTCTCNIS